MFERLFGETPEEQIQYLKKRVIITGICFLPGLSSFWALAMLVLWGWNTVKSLFHIASIGIIFSGNIVYGAFIFVIYILIAYVAGMIVSFLGIGRYIYLILATRNEAK